MATVKKTVKKTTPAPNTFKGFGGGSSGGKGSSASFDSKLSQALGNQSANALQFTGVTSKSITPKPAEQTSYKDTKTGIVYTSAGLKDKGLTPNSPNIDKGQDPAPNTFKGFGGGSSGGKGTSSSYPSSVPAQTNFSSTASSVAKKTKTSGGGGGSSSGKTDASTDPLVQPKSDNKAKPIMTDASKLLRQGATGPNISTIQTQLKNLGYDLNIDGAFGPQTSSVIKKFQEDNGLVVDGVVGPQTTAALQKAATGDNIASKTTLMQGQSFIDPAGRTGTVNFSTVNGSRLSAGGTTPMNPQTEIENKNNDLNSEIEDTKNVLEKTNAGVDIPTSASDKMLKALTDIVANKPEAPASQAELQARKRAELGIDPLESSLANLDAQSAKLDSERETLFANEDNRQVSVLQINRRKNQEQIQYEDAKRQIAIQRNSIANQLTNKYSVLDSFMKYSNMDYENSVQAYNTQFSQAISMINLIKGVEEDAKSEKEKGEDKAKGNLTLMLNQLKDKDWSSVDSVTKASITKLELSAGLPSGSFAGILGARDEAKAKADTSDFTKTELKTYQAYAGEISSYDDKATALKDLQDNKFSIIKDIGQSGYNNLIKDIDTHFASQPAPVAPTETLEKPDLPFYKDIYNFLFN